MSMLRESSVRLGHEVSAAVMVYDLHGPLGLGARKIIPFVRIINEVAAAHYPGKLKNKICK